jgi:hypothetical protein
MIKIHEITVIRHPLLHMVHHAQSASVGSKPTMAMSTQVPLCHASGCQPEFSMARQGVLAVNSLLAQSQLHAPLPHR